MKELVRLYSEPELNSPNMIASWPGIGNVSMIATNYLRRKLGFKELGEIEASHFFDPIGVVVEDGLVEAPQFPQSKFYYWQNAGGGSDIILFMGESQPSSKTYELARCVVDVAQMFQVKRIYTCAAALTRMHHAEQSRVWGVATTRELNDELEGYDLVLKENLHIAGLNGLLLGVTKESNIGGICLLGEVPPYATRVENPKAALAVLETLARMLDIQIDVAELHERAEEAEAKMKQITAEAMSEYIDHFTRPLWESGVEEEEEEEEE